LLDSLLQEIFCGIEEELRFGEDGFAGDCCDAG